jgi:hypothetical protein
MREIMALADKANHLSAPLTCSALMILAIRKSIFAKSSNSISSLIGSNFFGPGGKDLWVLHTGDGAVAGMRVK